MKNNTIVQEEMHIPISTSTLRSMGIKKDTQRFVGLIARNHRIGPTRTECIRHNLEMHSANQLDRLRNVPEKH